MELTKEKIQKHINELMGQQEKLKVDLYRCDGSVRALQFILIEMDKKEDSAGEKKEI